jgi:crotonobetainyl-CoA:carnitine CoA-transferase CaiB-like acyl-CoA transferase
MNPRPLTGVRILDLTHVWAGPLATRILADLGAEVFKVEAASARGMRVIPPHGAGIYPHGDPGTEPWNRQGIFNKLNRNKKGLSIDLKSDDGRKLLLSLAGQCDVIVENFSARTMPRLGLDYATLTTVNPGLIYLAMPGFGTTGPYRDFVAYGPSVEPMTGLTAVMGYSGDEPRMTAMALPDACAGVTAAAAIVTAIARRTDTGKGGFIDLSLHEAAISLFGEFPIERQLTGAEPEVFGNAHPEYAPHGIYPCSGADAWIHIAIRTDREWKRLCGVAAGALPDAAEYATAAGRRADAAALDLRVADWTRSHDKVSLMHALQREGIAAGAVLNAPELLSDPHLDARGFLVTLGAPHIEPFPYPGSPVRIDGQHAEDWFAAPRLGEHNADVLQDVLGLDAEEIARLAAAGVIVDEPPVTGRGAAWPA